MSLSRSLNISAVNLLAKFIEAGDRQVSLWHYRDLSGLFRCVCFRALRRHALHRIQQPSVTPMQTSSPTAQNGLPDLRTGSADPGRSCGGLSVLRPAGDLFVVTK